MPSKESENGSLDRAQFLKRTGAVGLAVAGAEPLLGALAGPAQARSAAVGTTLRLRVSQDSGGLDPVRELTQLDGHVSTAVCEPLVTYNQGKIVSVLAKTFKIAPDGRSVNVELKKGIRLHGNYGELTAEDVKFTLERSAGVIKTGVDSIYASAFWGALKRVKVHDKHKLTIELKYPSAELLQGVLEWSPAGIISKKAYEKLGPKGFAQHPIGSGPYEFVSWKKGTSVNLRRFAHWSGAYTFVRPQWKEINFLIIPDDNAAELALRAGQINVTDIRPASVSHFKSSSYRLSKVLAISLDFIGMNVSDPTLQDIRVRQALRLSFDVPSMITAAYAGQATRARAAMPPGTLGYWKGAPVYNRNVTKAKALLQGAHASNLQLTMTVSNDTTSTTIAQIAQANLADVGVQLKIQPEDPGSFFVTGTTTKTRQLFYTNGVYTTPTGDPSVILFPWFSCAQRGQWNWSYFCNPTYDAVGEKVNRELNRTKRAALVVQGQRLMDEAAFAAWVAYPNEVFATPAGIDFRPALGINTVLRAWAARRV